MFRSARSVGRVCAYVCGIQAALGNFAKCVEWTRGIEGIGFGCFEEDRDKDFVPCRDGSVEVHTERVFERECISPFEQNSLVSSDLLCKVIADMTGHVELLRSLTVRAQARR